MSQILSLLFVVIRSSSRGGECIEAAEVRQREKGTKVINAKNPTKTSTAVYECHVAGIQQEGKRL